LVVSPVYADSDSAADSQLWADSIAPVESAAIANSGAPLNSAACAATALSQSETDVASRVAEFSADLNTTVCLDATWLFAETDWLSPTALAASGSLVTSGGPLDSRKVNATADGAVSDLFLLTVIDGGRGLGFESAPAVRSATEPRSAGVGESGVRRSVSAELTPSSAVGLSENPPFSIPFESSASLAPPPESAVPHEKVDDGGKVTTTPSWIWGIIVGAILIVGAAGTGVGLMLARRRKAPPPVADETFDGTSIFLNETSRTEAAEFNHAFDNPLCDESDNIVEIEDSDLDELSADGSESLE
jgi:hypothetical protein